MPSPDVRPYVDLTLNDKDPQDLYANAVATLKTNLPEWREREGNTEVLLLEALALQVSEGIFAINRLPSAITEILAKLFGITRDAGAAPIANLEFTMINSTGNTIPAGTRVRLDLNTISIVFATNTQLVIPNGSSTGQVLATGDVFTSVANSVDDTFVQLMDSLLYVNTVKIIDPVTGGRDAETDSTYFTRAAQRFSRLNDTLVLPQHFVASTLEDPIFQRALALDNYTPATLTTPTGVVATPFASGGTLASATYGYRISAINAFGETLASATTSAVVTGPTGRVDLSWSAVVPTEGASPVTGYKVYGRTGGSELLLTTTGAGVTTYSDTGSATPSGALPVANTTGGNVGSFPGHITVAVYGPGRFSTTNEKTALDTKLENASLANLSVHIIDPTITAVDVTVSITLKSGYVQATVISAVQAALQSYLDPLKWGWGNTVYRNELIALIDNVAGVDRVVTLSVPASDLALSGKAPLAQADELIVSVV